MSHRAARVGGDEYSDVLGEPVMVPNPLITAGQAASILGLTTDEVYQLASAGIVGTHAADHKDRSYRLDDVTVLAAAITLQEAAEILGIRTEQVRNLISDGVLATTNQPLRPLRRVDVERRAAWKHPLRRPNKRRPQPTRDDNTVNTSTAARFLGIGMARIRQLAAAGIIPAVRDASGKF